jgi:starch synthase (maltosyl-transferring)
MSSIHQYPSPGSRHVYHAGDVFEVRLTTPSGLKGRAWLRTNLGRAAVRRDDLIRHVREGDPILHHDWHDIPMRALDDGRYALCLPLTEVGRFEAKAFLLKPGSDEPLWPAGDNTVIKVEPADTVCANTVYTAFVRQFGANSRANGEPAAHADAVRQLDESGYTVIPRSGTFRELARELDFIIGTLGFRILQLLPIHPVPTTYARMGRFGSPFATLDYGNVDPALAEFDRRTTPLQQFGELLDAVHARGAKLFMDMPINHTGWASHLQSQHPEWFARNADATFTSPGAWGVTWEDLAKLDYRHRGLWAHMAEVFLYWCRQGVDGFRCDAGYMVPVPVWEFIVAEVRAQFPNTLFLLEGLGGPVATMEALLDHGNLDWAYSELFQTHGRAEIEAHVAECAAVSASRGLLVHYAETHDNDRLAARSKTWAEMRTALAALCAHAGGFGIANGVEWFATQRIQVHGAASLSWGNPTNQVERIQRLGALLRVHPAFAAGARVRVVSGGAPGVFMLHREGAAHADPVLVAVNLDDRTPATASWSAVLMPGAGPWVDLLSGRTVAVSTAEGGRMLALAPGEAVCLAVDPPWLGRLQEAMTAARGAPPARLVQQRALHKVLELHAAWHGDADVSELDREGLAAQLVDDPERAVAAIAGHTPAPVARWTWPADVRRVVMVAPGQALLIRAAHAFAADVCDGDRVIYRDRSLAVTGGGHALLVPPRETPAAARECVLALRVFEPTGVSAIEATLLVLPRLEGAEVHVRCDAAESERLGLYAICANSVGATAQVRADWGALRSQYDVLLGANLHPQYPTDRRMLFTRCRAWLVFRGYSHPLDLRCLDWFEAIPGGGPVTWRFDVPCGLGKRVPLEAMLTLAPDRNAVTLQFKRLASSKPDHLGGQRTVRLILRPDIEDRGMHEKTKAYQGAEATWAGLVGARPAGFIFAPSGRYGLDVAVTPGAYHVAPEWSYLVGHPEEAARGLDGNSDLFSPGYFASSLKANQGALLTAEVTMGAVPPAPAHAAARSARTRRPPESRPLMDAMREAMRDFVVRRGEEGKTVIAGYPWFLDWGRDTMICLRGLIAAGFLEESRAILREFAKFEDRGTLPNLIHGADATNRDTSDAPLWFFTACADVCAAESSPRFLQTTAGGRTILAVLESIAQSYCRGTPNGIRMDPESGLIFSPSHFTWMDTNFPAGTPREGYPIEIQALWHAALQVLAARRPAGPWGELATRVESSVRERFILEHDGGRYLADCLYAKPGVPAARAEVDDACRPNQLLALTLGLVSDPALGADVLRACESLLVPGAIRSLADRPVTRPLPVRRDGRLLNDPLNPYWGRYEGDEDTRRKPAYHNGTAWTWLFPSYAEAWVRLFGEPVREAAQALLGSAAWIVNRDCLGHVPEILNGDAPHAGRGCGAQAWGCTELYRVLALLQV